ncbi:MAG: DUF378 domain-containing protein [Clostridium sp.]
MCKLNIFDKLSIVLVIIGSLNWGIIGLFDVNLVQLLTGNIAILMRIIYVLVGLAAVNLVYFTIRCTMSNSIC